MQRVALPPRGQRARERGLGEALAELSVVVQVQESLFYGRAHVHGPRVDLVAARDVGDDPMPLPFGGPRQTTQRARGRCPHVLHLVLAQHAQQSVRSHGRVQPGASADGVDGRDALPRAPRAEVGRDAPQKRASKPIERRRRLKGLPDGAQRAEVRGPKEFAGAADRVVPPRSIHAQRLRRGALATNANLGRVGQTSCSP
mmetsp:Transcript_12551/g.37333  ORF Transcript_12551/g.37333 Transcript_12551/m.37333 type:complete len:200 (-) Transcript_12551:140-739(-)